jgi:DNA-binding Lrp family transcriptional regulator
MQSSRYNGEGVSAVKTKAYILIETAVSRNREIIAALKKLQGINSVELVTGPYDIIAVLEADSLVGIGDIVTSRIHPVPGVNRTVTCLVMSS